MRAGRSISDRANNKRPIQIHLNDWPLTADRYQQRTGQLISKFKIQNSRLSFANQARDVLLIDSRPRNTFDISYEGKASKANSIEIWITHWAKQQKLDLKRRRLSANSSIYGFLFYDRRNTASSYSYSSRALWELLFWLKKDEWPIPIAGEDPDSDEVAGHIGMKGR